MREFGHNLTIFQQNSPVSIKYEKFEYHLPILQKLPFAIKCSTVGSIVDSSNQPSEPNSQIWETVA